MGKRKRTTRTTIPARRPASGIPADRVAPKGTAQVAKILTIRGKAYPAIGFRQAAPLHLIELKQQTSALGLGPGGRGFGMMDLEAADRDRESVDMEVMFPIMVFLSMRAAGEDVTFVAAASVPFTEIGIELEDAPAPAPVDTGPTAPGGPGTPAAPGERNDLEQRPATPGSSTT